VRHAIHDAHRHDLLDTLAAFAADMCEVNALVLGARSVQSRLKGVGLLSRAAAQDLGIVGLAARASGVPIDVRQALPGMLYTAHPVTTASHEVSGDCWSRLRLRMHEIDASVIWIRRLLEDAGVQLHGNLHVPPGALAKDSLCLTLCEGFRGPVLQALETGAEGQLVHYKVQDPSLLNWFGLAQAVRGNDISDFPICNKSFDLSYCGNDL
jgi:Ni,Fe-hydrogenase III large subunit